VRKKLNRLPLGSIVSGTTVARDMIGPLLGACDDLRMTQDDRDYVRRVERHLDSATTDDDDELDDALNTLVDVLSGYAPDYCYVGASIGDGADFGCWIDWDSVNHDSGGALGDIYRSNEPPPPYWAMPIRLRKEMKRRTYWLHVNDHGNATLYRFTPAHRFYEVWSTV
jgi:hypothetical protein